MGKVVSNLRRLRMEVAALRGDAVSVQEVADAVGIRRDRLTNLELGKFDRVDTAELLALSGYYTRELKRPVTIGDLLEIDEKNLVPAAA